MKVKNDRNARRQAEGMQRNGMTEAASGDWVGAKEFLPASKDGCDLCRRRHKPSHCTRGWRVFLIQKPCQPRSPFDFAGEPNMPAAGGLKVAETNERSKNPARC